MKNRNLALFFALALILGLIYGCASTPGGNPLDNFMKLSPKGKASVSMDLYIKVYDDTERLLKKPSITDDEKIVAKKKIDLLKKFKGVIDIYNALVVKGQMPSLEDEEQLINFYEEMLKMGVNL